MNTVSGKGRLAGASDRQAVLHIGYQRTATTTHQQQLFSRHKDIAYLGKPYPDKTIRDIVYRLVGADSSIFDLAVTRAALERVVTETVVPRGRVLMLSDEAMLSPYIGDTNVVCSRLLATFGDPKVLITIRRQDDLLISYLFHMIRKRYSRPLDVELREIESYGDISMSVLHFFDYSPVCRAFADALGRGNVLVIPYELFQSDCAEYSRRLSNFMGIGADETLSLLDNAIVSNQRQSESNAAYFDFRARYFPAGVNTPRLDENLTRLFGRFGFSAGRVNEVAERARHLCANRFAESNRQLSEAFMLDLKTFGYPGF